MSVSRRGFLAGSAAAVGAAASGRLAAAGAEAPPPAAPVPFDGPHQAGVLDAGQAQATYVALDAISPERGALSLGLEAVSSKARRLTAGASLIRADVDEPPSDSGILGPSYEPDGLTVTIGFGASLFDGRYGLKAPAGLQRMPSFPGDDLDPARCHGDVLLQICANNRDTVVHALRELMRPVRSAFALRWTLDGFQGASRSKGSRRNLFGFRDGTANPDVRDDALMRRLVWTPEGGTFQVVRAIRMHVEFWDRVGLREQENMIGRTRDTGAPLGGTQELQDPRLDLDPKGDRIPLDAHIRLANPRTPQTDDQRLLRRAFNYHRGFDEAGQLDQGLIFVAFNQDIERQFATIQKRLAGEPMADYVTPVGGGYFYAPPGSRGPNDWVGSGLFT
ncbi:Dyp-type peroxidase [Candidatus Solirubrobacter pratensis]|uniref:Dyp-type peroxidase n=1 Tax=Candidatus Solirubrobacter pratensis TaxID=1298857 RepID=UPI00041BE465|nr:Dyp-type peroxidase [Candidatus Solirubrobacter pratensis]